MTPTQAQKLVPGKSLVTFDWETQPAARHYGTLFQNGDYSETPSKGPYLVSHTEEHRGVDGITKTRMWLQHWGNKFFDPDFFNYAGELDESDEEVQVKKGWDKDTEAPLDHTAIS